MIRQDSGYCSSNHAHDHDVVDTHSFKTRQKARLAAFISTASMKCSIGNLPIYLESLSAGMLTLRVSHAKKHPKAYDRRMN